VLKHRSFDLNDLENIIKNKIVMTIDDTNKEFTQAVDIVLRQRKSLFLTGRAGSGKTYFLKYIREQCNELKINAAVVAPTGIAALNAGGQTIHSFFKVPISIFHPDDKRLRTKVPSDDTDKTSIYNIFAYRETRKEIIKNLEVLIIDEVSMLRCDLLDLIDRLLRVFRGKDKGMENIPFGGVQVVLIGDPFQLPPVITGKDWDILQQAYNSPWFFSSKAFDSVTEFIELQKIYRQTDINFIEILNKVRDNTIGDSDLQNLNQRFNPVFRNNDTNKKYMNITTRNALADRVNETELQKINSTPHIFHGRQQGIFPLNNLPAPLEITLKKGAQVMLVKNDSGKKYVNGSLGEVLELNNDEITIKLDSGLEFDLTQDFWTNIEYVWNVKDKKIQENIIGRYWQYPLKLAWCITVHKSQGLTFDYIIADLSSAFTTGQVYVALSRCTSLEGLVLKSEIPSSAIKTDPIVLEFYNKIKTNKL
jgi:ATP-dependent exoDNAse (exonuclease V) alpha subunit